MIGSRVIKPRACEKPCSPFLEKNSLTYQYRRKAIEEMKKRILDDLREFGQSSVNALAQRLDLTAAKDFRDLIKTLASLEGKKQVVFKDNGEIALKTEKKSEIRLQGLFRANKAGFGFVTIDEAEDDLFVGRNDVNYAVDGDLVEVVVHKVADRLKGTAAEGRIVSIVERSLKTLVGEFVLDNAKPKYAGYIQSKNPKITQRIYVRKEPIVLDGTEIIKVAIEKYPCRHHDYFVASVRDIIGHVGDVGIDVLEVLESMDIVSDFPDKVLAEAEAIPDFPQERDYLGRVDLRDELTFTIDGADAKDLDDAIHIKRLDNDNFELGVHIADVSYYVKEGSELDKEALKRGTSVYVTDRVVPMLPERLSNGICSLNPQVDRLTQSAIMEINPQGRVLTYQITQTVIKTCHRMTYSDVNAIIAGDEALSAQYEDLLPSIADMVELHGILESMRIKRGSLNFDTSEAKIIVDDKGMPVEIKLRERGLAERLIESFMLAANECVAEHFAKADLPFIYRIHEEPKADKLQKFLDYASVFGVSVRGTASKISQEALQDFMAAIEGQTGSEVLSMMLLRSMQQARYSEHNHGHYGLAAAFYTHFTSPIRRYPDLLVHRLIREYDQVTSVKLDHFASRIPEIASQSSSLERRAVDAERLVEAMKKAEYMEKHVGEEFEGLVSSVVKFGVFVELPNTIEGLIHVTEFPEYYHYNERELTLVGEKSGTVFRVGQPIKVRLTKADKATGSIDFAHIPSDLDQKAKASKSSKTKPKRKKQSSSKPVAKTKKKSSASAFYKDVAKKGSKHGKRTRKRRRTK